jgi:hypothetical protein
MIVVQTFGYATVAIRIFRYDTYSILKYGAILGKGAQHTSWGRSPSDPLTLEHDLNICTKHIDPQYHFIQCHIEEGTFQPIWLSTHKNVADIFTKVLLCPLYHAGLALVSRWGGALDVAQSSDVLDVRLSHWGGVLDVQHRQYFSLFVTSDSIHYLIISLYQIVCTSAVCLQCWGTLCFLLHAISHLHLFVSRLIF